MLAIQNIRKTLIFFHNYKSKIVKIAKNKIIKAKVIKVIK